MTYTNVNLILEGDAALRQRYAALVDDFELMRELAMVLNRNVCVVDQSISICLSP